MPRIAARAHARLTAAVSAAILGLVALGGLAMPAHAAEEVPLPAAVRIDDKILDPTARGVISYEGTPNIGSFQQDGLLSRGGFQYTAWYAANGRVTLSRRVLPDGAWHSILLPEMLSADDSHDVISLAVSPSDGRLHVVLGTHGPAIRYLRSVPGLADEGSTVPWSSASFSGEYRGFPGAEDGLQSGTYPVFETLLDGTLLFTTRSGGSNNGTNYLFRYDDTEDGTWTALGNYTSNGGSYATGYGTSTARYAYLHGFETNPVTGDLEIAYSWRELSGWCDPNGLGNHDLGYARSSDGGLTWQNNAGTVIGRTGTSDLISVADDHVVVPISINRGLINQEDETFDSDGTLHVVTSQFNDTDLAEQMNGCHTQTYPQRAAWAKPFHHWRDADGTWHTMELPYYNNSAGRSKLLFDADDTAYLVLPDARIAAATKATGWSDWRIVFDGADVSNIAELIVDRDRLLADGVLSVAYQETSTGNAPSAFRVADFSIDPGATPVPKSTTPEAPPLAVVPPAGISASASSAQPGYPASLAVDGDPSTFWVSGGTTAGQGPQPGAPEILTVAFDQEQPVRQVTVTPRRQYNGPADFRVEALVDGDWVPLGTFHQGASASPQAFDFPLVRTQSVRLVVTSAWDTNLSFENARNVQIAEVAFTNPDTRKPTSSVSAPAHADARTIEVAWTAEDTGVSPSGVAAVVLYALAAGSDEPVRLGDVPAADLGPGAGTVSVELPEAEGSYALYSIATDAWGNIESAPASPDASIVLEYPDAAASGSSLTGEERLSLSRDEARPGETIELTLRGARPGAVLNVEFRSTPVRMGTVVVAGDGTAHATIVVPGDATAGRHSVVIVADDGEVAVPVTIVRDVLAGTGGQGLGAMLGLSAGLVALGSVGVFAARRRRMA